MGILDVHSKEKNVHILSVALCYIYLLDIQWVSIVSIVSIVNIYISTKLLKRAHIFVYDLFWNKTAMDTVVTVDSI